MLIRKNQYILETTVSPEGRKSLEKYGTLISVPDNYVLIPSEDRAAYCYYIKSGRIMACDYLPNGEKRIYYCSGKGTLIGEEYIVSNKDCLTEYRTIDASKLIRIDKAHLLEAMNKDSVIFQEIIQSMANKIQIYEQRLRNEHAQSARWKLCSLILDFVKCHGVLENGHILIKERISQQQMAEILGINRITAVREMKKLREENLVQKFGQYYYVMDVNRLEKYVMEY